MEEVVVAAAAVTVAVETEVLAVAETAVVREISGVAVVAIAVAAVPVVAVIAVAGPEDNDSGKLIHEQIIE